ncbi:LacI family DNA-binding transcriptional regulator [Streptomyces calidiresistens]|uniref:LacI family DNA-binding transcriptional regulator n=1 Tax=Streptomyces calidiresistens TaxID=1485586 RepID=A0A7W3T8G3_9ACTN|nr:LacI family DNA-binding transcriptional regulator [Streptomyces calidiresistens]MBB0232651.1 LacI family DNA-binding transcriptional regulator [Streptomyces calidiresistens]
MAVTLADVAARAGVSAATVSRVLNGNYPVAGTTRSRVLRAVEELEYVVNGPASSLAAATSDLIGVLVNDIADPFFGIIAGGVQSRIAPVDAPDPRGRKLAVVCTTGGSPEQELTYLTLLQRQRAAAVILTGGAVEDPAHQAALAAALRRIERAGARVVLCGRPPLSPPVVEDEGGARGEAATTIGPDGTEVALPRAADLPRPACLAFDNRGGARALAEHLISLGHREIGYLAGPAERTTTRHRLEGHRAALEAAGLADGAGDRVVHGRFDRDSGYEGARELLRRFPGLTAIAAANDTVALGACAALREAGLRVPEDVSVTGFDDLPFAAEAAPALTTARLPLHEAGARAGLLALGVEEPPPGGVAVIGTELRVRASTAPPPSGPRPARTD